MRLNLAILLAMCGRFELENPEQIYGRFGTKNTFPEIRPNINVAPSQMVPIVFGDGEVELTKWGLVPSWAKDPKIGYKMINARAEGIEVKPSFSKPFHTRRCIVPSTGFYEWKATENGKVPYIFQLKIMTCSGWPGYLMSGKINRVGK